MVGNHCPKPSVGNFF